MKATIPSCLRTEFVRTHGKDSTFEIRARMPSEIEAISPLVDRMIRLIEESHCVLGEEPAVGLALREALNNAVLHGNRLDPVKLVQVHCRCEVGEGVSIVIKDQGRGFDPTVIADPSMIGNLEAEHGRGILLMRWLMDEVSFEFGYRGTEVHMSKRRGGVKHGIEK
jgi:serine/threonine-protein kinase RsbW